MFEVEAWIVTLLWSWFTKSDSSFSSPFVDALVVDDGNGEFPRTVEGDVEVDAKARKLCCPDNEFRPLFPTGDGVLLRTDPLLFVEDVA